MHICQSWLGKKHEKFCLVGILKLDKNLPLVICFLLIGVDGVRDIFPAPCEVVFGNVSDLIVGYM